MFFCLLATLIFGAVSTTFAQSEPVSQEASQIPADQSVQDSDFRFLIRWNSKFGSFTYVPENWGELHLKLENLRDSSRDLLCSTYFDEQPGLQFGRQIWLPANSRLNISCPVLIPKIAAPDVRTAKVHSLLIDSRSAGEVLLKNDGGRLVHDGAMLVTHTPRNTGIIAGFGSSGDIPKDVMDVVIATRVSQLLPNRVTVLADPDLPTDENCLNYLSHIVIAENSFLADNAIVVALRRWLDAGGHLWVMLDRADSVVLERLLGDDYSGGIVDRVGLTKIQFDQPATLSSDSTPKTESIDFDDPVEMVLMDPGDFKVAQTVNGWPAAMTKTCGEGRLLVTTVGARGWITPGQFELVKKSDPQFVTEFTPRPAMIELAESFFKIREETVVNAREKDTRVGGVLESISQEYIGYSIPSWGLVVGTLTCFTISLIAIGIGLMRFERLEHLGWTGAILAMLFAMILLAIGRTNRQSVPAIMATVQIGRAIKGTDDVRTEGAVAVYHPEGSQADIKTTRGGQLRPDMTGLEGTIRRLVMTDFGQNDWQNLPQAAGVREASFVRSESFPNRFEVRTTLDANGLIGTWPEKIVDGSDALVVTQLGRIGVKKRDDQAFTASADEVFESDQYLSAGFMGEEQMRRRRILEKLFSDKTHKGYREQPQLVVWSNQIENGFQFGENLKRGGTSLLAIPLIFDRPPNGTNIQIPSPLLTYRTRTNPDGSAPSAIWNDTRGEWQERSTPGLNWLAFQVPRELLPLSATKAKVLIKVTGPVGRLELMGLKQGQIVSFNTIMDPVGTVSFDITDADSLSISKEGILSLGVSGGDPNRPELTNSKPTTQGSKESSIAATSKVNPDAKVSYWRIESLSLRLWAVTKEPSEKSNE